MDADAAQVQYVNMASGIHGLMDEKATAESLIAEILPLIFEGYAHGVNIATSFSTRLCICSEDPYSMSYCPRVLPPERV